MEVPLFVPTSGIPIAGMASLPERGKLREPAVVMLPGYHAERIRIDAVRDAGRALAANGQPVLRLDYPGNGASPGHDVPREEAERMLGEATEWFRQQTGLSQLALGGTCAGGTFSITVAASNPAVRTAVVQGGRLRPRVKKSQSRIRAGLAAVGLPQAGGGHNVTYDENDWKDELLAQVQAATAHARLLFVYGEGDAAHRDLDELRTSGVLLPETVERIDVALLTGERVNTIQSIEHGRQLQAILEKHLSPSLPARA